MGKTVKVRDLVIGSGACKICAPIIGKNKNDILMQTRTLFGLDIDLVEWRADYYDCVNYLSMFQLLAELRNILGNIPIIYTFRTKEEGGEKDISKEDYAELLTFIAKHNLADIIDLEMISKQEIVPKLVKTLKYTGVKIIGSNHDFVRTPSKNEILSRLIKMEEMGADICKIAVTPKKASDVDTLMYATKEFYDSERVPVVTMSMSEMGAISRISGETTGSAITFASGTGSSAPGQISVRQVKNIFNLIWQIHMDYNIMLIGFMGTGKTTISSALKKITGLEEIDTDQYIAKKEGISISRMFETYGEAYFRKKETEALTEIQNLRGRIVSCGGGAVLKDENVAIMKKSGIIVLLTATPETVLKRVRYSDARPILNGNMSVEYISKMMENRKNRYMKVADITVSTDDRSIVDICEEILQKLLQYGKNS